MAEGGQRCAAHTRARYQAAAPGTSEWDDAAAQHASTLGGRKELQQALAAQRTTDPAGTSERTAALETALRRGEQLRERNQAVAQDLKCEACGGPMHKSTWGCTRPTPAPTASAAATKPGGHPPGTPRATIRAWALQPGDEILWMEDATRNRTNVNNLRVTGVQVDPFTGSGGRKAHVTVEGRSEPMTISMNERMRVISPIGSKERGLIP